MPTDPCAGINTGLPPECDACTKAHCCPQVMNCYKDPVCVALVTCVEQNCANDPNVQNCAFYYCYNYLSAGNEALAIQTCQQQNCFMCN